MKITKEENKALNKKIKKESEEFKYIAPSYYWAVNYHRNSRGERMDFTNMDYLFDLYLEIATCKKMVVEKSVQCGLSELFIIQSHQEAAEMGLSVMYVLPKYELRNRFVNNRIYKLHKRVAHYSELIRQSMANIHRTSLTHFGKGTMAFVGSNVESEFIEMPVDSVYVDELDRCNLQNLLLLKDRYTASPYKFHREISNPTVEGFGIDSRFIESSQAQWIIKCPRCGGYFNPDFFLHVVRQIGPLTYVPRDISYDEESSKEIALIHDCGAKVNRLLEGEWVHQFKNRDWKGFRISKVFNKHVPLLELHKTWMEAQGNELKMQVFYNSDLGLPYSAKGAKITTESLNRCIRSYVMTDIQKGTKIVGIDVGKELHYVVRDVVKEHGVKCLRLLAVGTVPSFELLGKEVLEKYEPRIAVIDALPEIHKVMELKSKYRHVYGSKFQDDLRKIGVNKEMKEVSMDRTAIIDYVKAYIEQETFLLPKNAEFLDNGNYFSQLTSSTRIIEVNEKNPDKSRYAWVHQRPDHYLMAEVYCIQAYMLLPNVDVLEFFEAASKENLTPTVSKIEGITEEEKKNLERLSQITSNSALMNIQKSYVNRNKK